MDIADMHIHSTKSDGLLSPSEIVSWGIKKNLKAISITDHDNIEGIHDAVCSSAGTGLEVIPGVELSTEYKDAEVHMLGYFIDYEDSELKSFLKNLSDSRIERAQLMIKKLNNLGYSIEFEEVKSIAKDAFSIGRPHIARVMVSKGLCINVKESFEKFLSYGKPAYVERYKISPFEALEAISMSHGLASIAHPGLIINIDIKKLIKRLKEWGLTGIEVYHTNHTKEDVSKLCNIAEAYSLIPTGGSDCHGVMENNMPLLGTVTVPYENVSKLKELIPNSR